jgi:predicted N-formylglutamate amidohydrolase
MKYGKYFSIRFRGTVCRMGKARGERAQPIGSVEVINGEGRGRIVLACDHASNFLPVEYGTLGLDAAEMQRHIAWDPGALPVATELSRLLDAPLVASRISRLVIDCNRPLEAADLIPALSEATVIPGNKDIDAAERRRRIVQAHQPFHDAIDAVLDEREGRGDESWLVSIHSYTPVYRGVPRPSEIGIIHDEDERIATPLIAGLRAVSGLTVGVNQPYSPADRVYYTLERHARARCIPCAMIEIRNDKITNETSQRTWAELLAGILSGLSLDTRDTGDWSRASGMAMKVGT